MPDADEAEPKPQSSKPDDRLWELLSRYRAGRLVTLGAAFVIALSALGDAVGKFPGWYTRIKEKVSQTKWPSDPVVLYIYPNDEFGVLRKDGFTGGVKKVGNKPVFRVEYLHAPYISLKEGNISQIKETLADRLKDNNVVAVAAPSITEATRPVIEFVRERSRHIPIIIESSIDPGDLKWREDKYLFRLSSGVDTRGADLGHIIKSLVEKRRSMALIVEDTPNTYGGRMYHHALDVSRLEVGSLPSFKYTPNSIKTKLDPLFLNKTSFDEIDAAAIRTLQNPDAVIFFLGVGRDLEPLLDLAYREKSPLPAKAKIVGLMNAYKLADLYRPSKDPNKSPIKSDLIFEITDFDIIPPANPPGEIAAFKEKFLGEKPLTPVLRDQAYSYDEATLLSDAIADASKKAVSYSHGLSRVNAFLHNYKGRGVTGDIELRKGGTDSSAVPVLRGQNVDTILRLFVYHRESGTWKLTDINAL